MSYILSPADPDVYLRELIQMNKRYLLTGIMVTLSAVILLGTAALKSNLLSYIRNFGVTGAASEKIVMPENRKIYMIREGDDLWSIAEKYYGSGLNAYDIADANRLAYPDAITIGQKIVIPPVTPKPATVGEISAISSSRVTITGDTYLVQPGDELHKIASAAYGDESMMWRIAEASGLYNPDYIEAGWVLVIPR